MKNIAAATLLVLWAICAPTAASAGPLYGYYQFEVLSWGCVTGGPACGGTYGPERLESIGLGVAGDAGRLQVSTRFDSFPDVGSGSFSNSNIVLADLAAVGTPIDFSRQLCMTRVCEVDVALDVTDPNAVVGRFRSLNDSDMFEMSGTGPLWSGRYISDNGHRVVSGDDYYIVFSGVWRVVPEPPVLVLFGLGLVGLIGCRRRRRLG